MALEPGLLAHLRLAVSKYSITQSSFTCSPINAGSGLILLASLTINPLQAETIKVESAQTSLYAHNDAAVVESTCISRLHHGHMYKNGLDSPAAQST